MYSRLHLVLRRPVPDALFIQRKAKAAGSPSSLGLVRQPGALGFADSLSVLLAEHPCLAEEAFLPAHHAGPESGALVSPARPSSTDIAVQLRHLFVGVGLPASTDDSPMPGVQQEEESASPLPPSDALTQVQHVDDEAVVGNSALETSKAASDGNGNECTSSSEDICSEAFVLVTKRHSRHSTPVTTQSPRNTKIRKQASPKNHGVEAAAVIAGCTVVAPVHKERSILQRNTNAASKVAREPSRSTAAASSSAATGVRAGAPPAAPSASPDRWAAAHPPGSVMAAAIAAGVVPARRPLASTPPQPRQDSLGAATVTASPSKPVRLNPAAAAWQPLLPPATDPVPSWQPSAAAEAGARPCLISRLPAAQVSGCECRACFDYAEAAAAEGLSIAF